MSATDPTGEGGGGGGGGEGATTTSVEQKASPSTPATGATAQPVQPSSQQPQQQQQQPPPPQQQPQQQQQQPPQQQPHPPPSPLSGCYLLVVLPESHTAQHKDLILNRLAKGFLSWDKDSCHVDLEKELLALVAQAPEGEEARNGERLIQYATENLVTEVLIHPQTNTLLQCIRNLLASFTKHRHIIHAGYTFGGNGSWILQDGTFSLADFLDAFSEHEVQRVLRAYENSVTVDIHCAGAGDWTTSRLSKEGCCRSCRVRVNPDDVLTAGVPAITSFTNYIGQYLVPQTLDQLMEPSDVVGNIRFSHPTLYVFPGGQGDAALFGINGFNMLVDGGFARKACFWDFTRHLDRLDAVLVTRINNSNIGGMFSVLRKKKELHVYPQIGHFFCNLVERRQSNSPDGDKDVDPLILNLTDIGQEMVLNLRHINLRAHPCYRDPDPINLYHKVGHGTLDMYVLSPSKDSREVREFLAKWHASDSKLFAGSHKKDSNNLTFPIQNLVSICALLVWQPANPEDNITRILFPGSTPQHKIFEGFDRLKHLDFLKHPVCSAKTLSPSTSLATLRDKPVKKLGLIEREPKKILESRKEKREPSEPKSIKITDEIAPKTTPQSTPIIPTGKPKAEIKTRKVAENKKIEIEAKESKKIEKELKEVKREAKKEPKAEKVEKSEKREDDIKKTDLIKSEPEKTVPKEPKSKPEPKKKETKESKIAAKAELMKKSEVTKSKLSEKKAKLSGAEKKDAVKSSPTTPKKTLNGTATKTEIAKAMPKAKPAAKVTPSLPAKSAKEANNRKVVEQKKSQVEKSAVKETTPPVAKMSAKPKPIERKPISRRTKPVSPSKARMPGSPAKSTRSTPTASVKSDKDGVIRKVKGDKGTTDSSTVSTPSGIEPEAVKPIDKSLIERSEDISLDSIESKVLADLKEEREVVEEIEAVLQKAERIEEIRKDDRFEGDDEITAEATDKKEEDITEEDVTAEIEDAPKKEGSRKESQELTEEDEYLIVEKEEVYTEDSAQSGEGEQKHVLDEAESEKAKILKDVEAMKEKGEKEEPEEKGKDESPEKKVEKIADKGEKEVAELSSEHKEQLQEEVKEIIASATEIVQKAEEKDDSGKKDSEDITKEPSSLSPDKLDSSEKKTTDTDMKPDVDQKEQILEKMEESQERISTIESGATTTAPTLPEDERIPLDEIKEDIDEKHVIEEVKEKDAPAKVREEVVPETTPAADKPEVKVFDVRQAVQNLQRDIVKTPDEVADLPVHEEVDPKLYRMEDFEKGKEEKPSPTPQDIKEPPTPPVKEQKGVFSFFGKVADKFEKGIDKLTKKSKKDTEKDSDEKSSSKSSSPKEPKVQEKTVLEEVDMEKMFPKVGKPADKPEIFEEAKPTIAHDVKVAAIKETVAFIQEEILDARKQSAPDVEEKLPSDKLEEIKKAEVEIEETFKAESTLPAAVSPPGPIEDKKEIEKEIELLKEEDIEGAEEVKALLEEASKKFKTVKDSLRDSLESLEEKIKEEEMGEIHHEVPSPLKDAVKDTLEGVAEKLEVIKPHMDVSPVLEIKEPEKVKFAIPKDEEFEEEYEEEPEGPYRDMKEAVRDVGEVLAGTAGIDLEEKDVIEIVKKVAEVLKEDDFLSDKALFEQAPEKEETLPVSADRKPSKEEISPLPTERKPSVPSEKVSPDKIAKVEEEKPEVAHEDIVIPTKVGVTEVSSIHGKIEKPDAIEVKEEPCVKVIKEKDDKLTSPVKDAAKDKRDAQKICAEMLKDDQHICEHHKEPFDDDTRRGIDVMQAGIESVCVKEVAKRPSLEEKLTEDEIEEPVISFEQKVSPAKAEIVMVTPGSTPTSPKFSADLMYGEEFGFREPSKLPEDIKQILNKEAPVEEVIEELIITKRKKITIEVIEYITVVKRIPRERVIYIIEEIIVKRGLPRESVTDDPEILKLKESVTPEKRMEVEQYILNEYIVKGKRITIEVVEEISIKKVVPKKIVVEIIEEIIVKRKIARHMVLDVPEDVLSEIIKEESPEESPEDSAEEQITPKIDIATKRESIAEVPSVPTEMKEPIMPQKRMEVEEFIVNEYIIKGKKITAPTIDEISAKKNVSKQILIEIIEEIIIKKKVPRNEVLDITEEEITAVSKETSEDKEEKEIPETEISGEKRKSIAEVLSAEIPEKKEPVTPQKRAEVEAYIVNEYITKGDNITVEKLEEICGKKKVSKRIIIEIIEEIILKRKMPRHLVLSVTEEELSRVITEETTPEPEVLTEKEMEIVEKLSIGKEKKSLTELREEEDKEDVLEDKESEDELSAVSEEEDIEEEVDGFVSIPRRISAEMVDTKRKPSLPIKAEISPTATKEHEKDVIDDFEAVEQEYKVHDVPIASPEKADEMKEKEDVEDTAEDTTSEVIEADEKFVQETIEKAEKEEPRAKDLKPAVEKREPEEPETSEISEIIDTTEKYLDEAKEKTDDVSRGEIITKDDKSRRSIPIEAAILQDVAQLSKEITKTTVQELDAGLLQDDQKPESLETTEIKEIPIVSKGEKSPQEMPEEALRKKKSISKESEEEIAKVKDEPRVEDTVKPLEKIKDEKLPATKPSKIDDDIGTVKRMLVTACSEDGREETDICPTGTITFTKITPDDSLKDASVKSTPDKDSLLLDKDSLHSGVTTPEKDSISEKSVPEGKDKITPEDSLDKSPVGTRDSQDFEDSLEKAESRKSKDAKISAEKETESPEEKQKEQSKSPVKDVGEIEKVKSSIEKIAEKIEKSAFPLAPEAAEKVLEKPKSPAEEKLEKPESPTEEKIEKSKLSSPLETKHEDVQKPKSPLDTTAEKSPIESLERPKLPIEKALPESDKGATIVSKTPESLHSEDVSPAETIFSKSPTEKPEMYFAKIPISEEDVVPEAITEKLSESIKETKPIADDELSMPLRKEEAPSPEDKDRIPDKLLEAKEPSLKPTSPVTSDEKPPTEKSRSPSISSEKHEGKEDAIDKSRSPSIISEPIDKERRKSSFITTDEAEDEKPVEKSRSSSIEEITDKTHDAKLKSPVKIDEGAKEPKLDDKIAAESKQSEKSEEKIPDRSKSSSIASEKSEQDIKSLDRSPNILSDKAEEEVVIDKPKSPSVTEKEVSGKPPVSDGEHYGEKGPIDEARSPSAISDKSDEKREAERSRSPSVAADKPDLRDVTERYLEKPKSPIFDRPESPKVIDKTEEPHDKDRPPSVASDKSDSKKVSDRSRSPSITVEKIDLKDTDLSIERARSPSVTSVKDDKVERIPMSKSPVDEADVPKDLSKSPKVDEDRDADLRDVMQPPLDRSRSPSVSSVASDKKAPVERSKSPSIADEKPDLKDVAEQPLEKSRSPSVVSSTAEQKEPTDLSKVPPSIVGEKSDLKDAIDLPLDKSRSSSVASVQKELVDRSKSPSIADEKPDLKDVAEQPLEKSRSPSVVSSTAEQKEPTDLSKVPPSTVGEKSDLKDAIDLPLDKSRSSSVASVQKEPVDRSKSPSIADEKPDLKDVAEQPLEKSRSPSVVSSTAEQKEPTDLSKVPPSTVGEKSDLKDAIDLPLDKSRSSSVASVEKEPVDRSKSPSIADEKPDLKDVAEQPLEKSRSPSVVSSTAEQKEPTDLSKAPPSTVGEKSDLKDVIDLPLDTSRSSSVASVQKEPVDRSKSPSIADEKPDLKDVAEQPLEKSRSPSVVSSTAEQKEPTDLSKVPPSTVGEKSDLKDVIDLPLDTSRSSSVASVQKEPVDRSKSPSIADEKPDLKDVAEQPLEKSRSPSVVSSTAEQKEPTDLSKAPPSTVGEKSDLKDAIDLPLDKSRSSSAASVQKEPVDRSKSPSIADEKPDLKDVAEQPLEKSRSPSVVSSTVEQKEPTDLSKAPLSTVGEKSDLKDAIDLPLDKSKSSSVASVEKEPVDRSKSPSVADEKPDMRDETEIVEPSEKSRSPSVASVTDRKESAKSPVPGEKLDEKEITVQKEPIDLSKSPGIADEKPDVKDVDRSLDKSRSASVVSVDKEPLDRSKSPSIVDEKADFRDIAQPPFEKSRSPSERSKSPSVIEEKPDLRDDTERPDGKSRSPSAMSVTSDSREPEDHRSKLPSVTGEKSELKDVAEQRIGRSPSASSVAEDHEKLIDKQKSPGIDTKQVSTDRSKSPSAMSEKSDDKKSVGDSKSSSIAGDKVDLADVTEQPADKFQSPGIASVTSDGKEPLEKSKSPTIVDKKEVDRSKSPSVASERSEEAKSAVSSKPSSVAGDTADMRDISEAPRDKSRSSSVISVTTDEKEPIEKSLSPTIPHKSEESHDGRKSPSVISEKSDGKKSTDGSRATSVTEERADLKDVVEAPSDKSRSSSVASLATEKAEKSPTSSRHVYAFDELEPPVDRSKSPGTTSDKSDEKASDDKIGREHYEDASDKSPNLVEPHKKDVDEGRKSPTVPGKLDAKPEDFAPDDKPRSPSIVLDKPVDDIQLIERVDVDGLHTSSTTDDATLINKIRSLSIISDRTEPKSSSDVSKSPSLADDKFEEKSKSQSSSVASEKLDDIDKISPQEAKGKQLASPSLDTERIAKDESAKSSRAGSPDDKSPKDRSRSQSVFDIGDKSPASRSRTASLLEDKLPEKMLPQKDRDALKLDTGKLLDETDERKTSPQKKSPITSPKTIQKEMQKIREKRFADFKEPDVVKPSEIEKSDDEEEDVVKVTVEKKAEIERYILDEFIVRKRKISLAVIEKLVMTYSVPQFTVMEIIEEIISRQNVPKSAVFDFVDDESAAEVLAPQKRADVEKFINEEFIEKRKKITPEALEEMVVLKGTPRYVLIAIIEEIVVKRQIPRSTVIEGNLAGSGEKSPDVVEDKSTIPIGTDVGRSSVTQEHFQSHGGPSDTMRDESPDGKVSPTGSDQYDRDAKALSASPSLSPEPIPSDKSTQDSPVRSEPHIDEEILISEEKRIEIEKLLEEEYIKKGRKITEVILEEIIIRTSLPRYIILEIVEEIILKRKIPRESVVDPEIYQEEQPEEDYDKAVYRYEGTADVGYELPSEARKSSMEYRMGVYPESGGQQLDKSDYPDYESQFHKAFVGGMTEMRTTHITTLSGKSTPEYVAHDKTLGSGIEPVDKGHGKLPERTLTTTHITRTDAEDSKTASQPVQTVTILRESKITESHPPESPEKRDAKREIVDKDESKEITEISKEDQPSDDITVIKAMTKREVVEQEEPAIITKVGKHEIGKSAVSEITTDDAIQSVEDIVVVKKIIKREVIEGEEPEETIEVIKGTAHAPEHDGETVEKVMKRETIESQVEPEVVVKEVKRPSIQRDEPEAITKIIKREIVEHDEPEVVTKVVKREIIEQDEPEIITKVIRREIVVPEEDTDDTKEDSGEYVKTITTKTTRTIVTEELPDAELSQTDPSKIYTDPTSGTTYRVVSDEGAPDATASADVKRIVTTVTTITGPDGKVITKKDVTESTDTVDSEELLEKLIDSGKITAETTKSAEKIIKETLTTVTSGTSTPDVKTFYDSGKSTPEFKQEEKAESTAKEQRLGADKFEQSPLVRDLISDDKSYSGKSSPDISLPKDIVFSGSTGKSTPEVPVSPLIRDGVAIQLPHLSGRSTPDRKSDGRSSTATPEGFRSGEMIRTIITTTKTISDEGEIVTTTREVTETTNEKGETLVLAEKTDVKIDERLPGKDAAESAISSIIGNIKSSELQQSGSPGSDETTSEKDRGPTSPSSEHSGKATTHLWSSSEERQTYSDDEPPSSPLSSTSQVGYSPQVTRRHEPTSSSEKEEEEEERKQVEFSAAAMSSSFYGDLPAVPPQISAMKTFHGETSMLQKSSDPIPIHSRFTIEKEFAGGYGEKSDAKKYIDEADLDFDKALMEHKEMKDTSGAFSSGIAPRYTNGSLRHETDDARDHPSSSFRDDDKDDSKSEAKKDPLEGWGTPLGLPSPKPPRKFNLKSPSQAQPSCSTEATPDSLSFDVVKNWGEPLRLPSPAPVTNEVSNKGAPSTPKKERKQTRKVQSENIKNKKRSESPGKNEKRMKDSKNKVQPVYMDLAYVPHHGNSYYTSLEFFKRVRARYYVFSGTEPSREVYDALLEAKKTWDDKDLEVTMIPTYDTDTLGYWVADNEEALAANHIDLSPSASRCTINLQDHETSCSAYRLEF